MRVWATEWDVFHCTPSRGGRSRRAVVDICRGPGVFLASGGISCFFFRVWWDFVLFFFRFLRFERTRPTASTRQPCLMYISTSNEAVFCLLAKKPLHTGVRTGCHYLISLSVCLCVCNIRRFY